MGKMKCRSCKFCQNLFLTDRIYCKKKMVDITVENQNKYCVVYEEKEVEMNNIIGETENRKTVYNVHKAISGNYDNKCAFCQAEFCCEMECESWKREDKTEVYFSVQNTTDILEK